MGMKPRSYANLRDLFEKHWMYGFPLWLANGEKDCVLSGWLRKVRQAAALYRIDAEQWAIITNDSNKRFTKLNTGRPMPHVADKVELVKRSLNMFENAVKNRLG